MDSEIVDEDSIDTEALQAQIDLSMSYAQNLVSSWMEAHKLPTSPRKRDLEKELSEYIKRPLRLGVGASMPEGHQNMSREAARLKGKLTSSGKRLREGGDEAASAPGRRSEDDNDEDESRAGAIKKKQKPDPFDVIHGKKKKKHHAKNESEGKPTVPIVQSPSQNAQADAAKPGAAVNGSQFAQKQKAQEESPAHNVDTSPPQDPVLKEKEDLSTSARNGHSAKPESVPTSTSRGPSESVPTSPTSTLYTAVSRNSTHEELLKRPLLNLTGPLANSDGDESDAEIGATESPLTSPKKKRKRRKKRKQHPITSEQAGDSAATATSDILQGVRT